MNFYLEKYAFQSPEISQLPLPDLGIVVVIPSHNEEDIRPTLRSLANCNLPECSVEVIVMVNAAEDASEEVRKRNQQTIEQVNEFQEKDDRLRFFLLSSDNLPNKHAGVGLARKIGMDEAVHRFHLIGKEGLIVCFDADSQCDTNYLMAIEHHFKINAKSPGCSVYFEHPVSGDAFDNRIYNGIVQYELHLRYYNQCLRFCELPYAFHTIGSSMVVRSDAYRKQGGMNRRKAGEDFYFLHKIIALGNFTELNDTRVIPSPRSSDRVPFGTGRAIQSWLEKEKDELGTYSFESFELIRRFVSELEKMHIDQNYAFDHPVFNAFLNANYFSEALEEIKANTTDFASFRKRFFVWFDAFRVLKLVHFLRDEAFPNQPVMAESVKLLGQIGHPDFPGNALEGLMVFRALDRRSI